MSERTPRTNFGYVAANLPTVTKDQYGDITVGRSTYSGDYTAAEAHEMVLEALALYRYVKSQHVTVRQRIEIERAEKRAVRAERDANSLAMLKEGASYTEVSETFGWSRNYLADKFPGFGWTSSEGGQFGMAVRHTTGFDGMVRPPRVHG